MLTLKHFAVSVGEQEILRDVNFTIKPGEVHVLTGKNGAGKSSLAGALAGLSKYRTAGEAEFLGADLLSLSLTDRAKRGLFLAFQTPPELPGVTLSELIQTSLKSLAKPLNLSNLYHEMHKYLSLLDLPEAYADRDLTGFSGGEKKKIELLELFMLKPKLAILDEIDSGLDKDSLKRLPEWLKIYHQTNNSLLIISHNRELISRLNPDKIERLENGQLV